MRPISVARHSQIVDPFELPSTSTSTSTNDLVQLRLRIDEIDARLRSFLHDRAALAARVGDLKRARGEPLLAAAREHEVLSRVRVDEHGPMPALVLEDVFRVVVQACRRLQERPRVGCLGPAGSLSHVAARLRFGATAEIVPLPSMTAVVDAAAATDIDVGIVPVEARGGRVEETQAAVARRAAHVRVTSEFRVPIVHQLLGRGRLADVAEIRSRPEVFRACTAWIAEHCPLARLVTTPSTSAAVLEIANANDPKLAAIGSALAGELYGVPVVARIGDTTTDAHTLFWLVRSVRAEMEG